MESNQHQDASGAEARVDKILTLFRNMGQLNTQIDFEHSFKAVGGHLFADRFLLGFNRRETGASGDESIASICANIGMPQELLGSFSRALGDANQIYFGVEKNAHTLLYKAYLEYRDKIEGEIGDGSAGGDSFRLFTGFKWDAFSPSRQAITFYDWYPALSIEEIHERLQTTLEPTQHSELLDVVQGITRRAAQKTSHYDIQYLEVSEDGNPRRSFDINIYKSGLRLEDLCPYLLRALRQCDISFDRFDVLYQRIKNERFGHLAGGIDRENNDFMTVYYGVKSIHSDQLGSAKVAPADQSPQQSG